MLQLHLLGTPKIEQAGQLLPRFKNRKAEALLFYLAVRPGQHQRAHLAALLWSEMSQRRALSNLRHALWTIRQTLGEGVLEADRLTVTLQPTGAVWVDVELLNQAAKLAASPAEAITPVVKDSLQQAADAYRGEFLAEVEVIDAELFDEWLQQQRLALQEQAIKVLNRLATYYTHHHHLPQAIAATRRLLELEPWQETAQQQLMSLLALSGQRGAALEAFHTYRHQLQAEMGLEPEPKTVALMETIRADRLTPPPVPTAEDGSPPPALPLLGRHTEFAWLIDRWQTTRTAGSRLLLLQAEAGVGKSHLVDEFGRYVQARGGLTLSGHASEYGAPLPFQPLAAALRATIDRASVSQLALSELELAELAQLAPALHHRPVQPSARATPEAGAHRYRLFEAVVRLLQNLAARQPVALILEDLQWADADTFDLLAYLVRRLDTAPVLVIGTYRPGEVLASHPLLDMRRSLFNAGLVDTLKLDDLNRESIEQLVQTLLAALSIDLPSAPSEKLADSIWRISRGNPFVAFEALQEMHEQGQLTPGKIRQGLPNEALAQSVDFIPGGVKSRVQRRVARLPRDSQQLLSLAAVIDGPFDVNLLQQSAGLAPETVLDFLDDWLARRLVKELPLLAHAPQHANYDFDHDLTRAALTHELSLARRRQFHRQIALAFEALYQGRRGQVVHHLAYHFHLANDHANALNYLQRAAGQAKNAFALHAALRYYRQALQHWEQFYGLPAGAPTHLPLETWRLRWELLINEAELCRNLAQFDGYQTALETAATEMADWGNRQDELRVVELQIRRLEHQPDLEARCHLAEKGLALAEAVDDPLTKAKLLQTLANCERDLGRFTAALDHYQAALVLFFQLNETRRATFCLISVGSIHLMADRFDEALGCFDQAVAYARAEHGPESLAWSYQLMAYIRENLGRM